MNTRVPLNGWLLVAVAVVFLAATWVVGVVMAQEPDPGPLTVPLGGSPTWTFTYQGQLNDDGRPADGFYDFIVTIWDASTLGSQVGSAYAYDDPGVLVESGIFSINIPPGARDEVFNGGDRWIQIEVRPHGSGAYTTLPRQPITAVPYAWGLMPGAVISGTTEAGSSIFNVQATGGPAVYGYSADDVGVYGVTDGTAVNDFGVYGVAGGTAYGVHGVHITSGTGLGVYGSHVGGGSGVSGYNAGIGNGTWGYSSDYNGVAGATGRADNNYGLYTADNLYSFNYHLAGAVMQVVQNGDTKALERGDTVVVAGLGTATVKGAPILQVRSAREAGSTAVLGVVASTYSAAWLTDTSSLDPTGATGPAEDIPLDSPGPIHPGEYLLVVVHGPCLVKVDAADTPIQPGDLLSTAGRTGYAAKAAGVNIEGIQVLPPGTVFGKALEPLDAGQDGLIYVYVTLQ